MKALALVLLVGCAVDPSASLETGETSEAMTVIDQCAVGHAPNATDDITVGTDDRYVRSGAYINHDEPVGCSCKVWKEINDLNSETAADAEVPTCRPEAIVEYTFAKRAGDDRGVSFTALGDFTAYVSAGNLSECSASQIHMELWRETTPGVYTRFWEGTKSAIELPAATATQQPQCMNEVNSPTVTEPGVYRVKAMAPLYGEHGYGDVEIDAY